MNAAIHMRASALIESFRAEYEPSPQLNSFLEELRQMSDLAEREGSAMNADREEASEDPNANDSGNERELTLFIVRSVLPKVIDFVESTAFRNDCARFISAGLDGIIQTEIRQARAALQPAEQTPIDFDAVNRLLRRFE